MTERCVLMAITEKEATSFLSPHNIAWLHSLPGFRWKPDPGEGEWLQIICETRPAAVIGCWSTPRLPLELLEPDNSFLKYVCYLAGSIKSLVPRELIANGLIVTNWGFSISRTIAEHALLLTLMALRRASHWTLQMHREGAWKEEDSYTESLFGRRVGIHGFGAIARELVALLRPFGAKLQTYAPGVPEQVIADYEVRHVASLRELFSESDVLIELAPLTPANHHIVDQSILQLLPAGATFVNIGRGAVVDPAALIQFAQKGEHQIALDVFENEPLERDSPLRGMPNVTLTPHLGGPTSDRRTDAGDFAVANLRKYLAGESVEAAVTLDIFDASS